MKLTKICLDLDGVLNKFQEHALRHVGCPNPGHDPAWGFDIVKSANEQHPIRKFTPAEFWSAISRDVWATAPLSDECHCIIAFAEQLVGWRSVCILTTPTLCPDSLAGKLEWIHAKMPPWLHRQYLVGPAKEFCARSDTLLIDDADHNVNRFVEHGGQALLVPRPWNSGHTVSDTLGYLEAQFTLLKETASC